MKHGGFTLIEMLLALVLVGTLSAIALPRLSLLSATQSTSAQDQVASALRVAAKAAAGHRRLVCVNADSDALTLRIAQDNPSVVCDQVLTGPDGQANRLSAGTGLLINATPQSTLYFQPNGSVSLDAAGVTSADFRLTVRSRNGETVAVAVTGRTGAVQ